MTYASEVLADGPLGYWRFGEASGTTLVDSSGNSHNGTYNSTPTHPARLGGEVDTAFSTDAGVNYASVPTAAWLDVTQITLEAWIKPAVISGANQNILDRDNETLRRFQFRINTSGKLEFIYWLSASGPFFATGATTLVAGTTYHVAATYDGTSARIFLNGVQDGIGSQSGSLTTGGGVPLLIGRHNLAGSPQAFNGTIDDVAYYGTALSQTRLAAHYTVATTVTDVVYRAHADALVEGAVDARVSAVEVDVLAESAPDVRMSRAVVDALVFIANAGTLSGSLPTFTADGMGRVDPVGSLSGVLPTLTAAISGTTAAPPVSGVLAGNLPSLTGTGTGTSATPQAPSSILTGVGGTFTVDFSATPERTVNYTPTFNGSLVIQAVTPAGWQPVFTVTDADGDEIQTDTGALGLIAAVGEPLTIDIAATPGQPAAPVTFRWSYAARASSPLSIAMDDDQIRETPTGLSIDIYNGQPEDRVTLSIIGATAVADFQTARLDTFGVRENLIVRLPSLDVGDYYLRVEGDASGSEDTPFTVLEDPLAQGDDGFKLDDTAPPRTPVLHWRFFDLRDHDVNYTFPRNPSSWTNVYPPNDFTHDKTTAPDGQPLTWQAAARPWRMEFTGWLGTQQEYEDLLFWSQLRRRLWLIDHRNRAWLITIEHFDAQAQVKPNLPWAHQYTVKTLVFQQG